jgi:hypothetical protein
MCLFKVYTGYTRDIEEHLLVTAETRQYAEIVAHKEFERIGIIYKLPLNVELVFEDLTITNVSGVEGW